MNSNFTGTGVALVTPFNETGSIDYESLKKLLTHIISGGVDYIVVNGTTAESATLTENEKKELLDFVISEVAGKVSVVYGIGSNNTAAVISKIKATDFSKIAGVLSISPYYNKPSQEGIYQHYAAIANACPVPLILYNVPGRTSSNMSARTTIRLSQIENIVGIKEAHGDLTQSLEILKHARKDFLLISGDDMLTIPMISLGGKGVISVLANSFPLEYSKIVHCSMINQFSKATEILQKLSTLNPLLYEEGNPVGVKFVLQELGICKEHVRLPLFKASDELKQKIKEALKEII